MSDEKKFKGEIEELMKEGHLQALIAFANASVNAAVNSHASGYRKYVMMNIIGAAVLSMLGCLSWIPISKIIHKNFPIGYNINIDDLNF